MTKGSNPFDETFSTLKHLPFLFVGAGMSRRYMGTPGWTDLLRLYANIIHPGNDLALETFKETTDDEDWPAITSRIEKEFNQLWLTHEDFSAARKKHATAIKSGTSPFKLEVARYFASAKPLNQDKHLIDELATLSNVAKRSVAGLITTNYDSLLEGVFKDYDVFIGQEQLLFSNTQGVAEIYKIHGCCSDPNSIIINGKDYEAFNNRNAYLAAKLLTVFVEHPIIFLGYSISDPNIKSILEAITSCLSQENLELLRKRLIFVEYSFEPLDSPEISGFSINFGKGTSIEMTRIKLNNFLPLYSSLLSQKFQYNPKLLRQLKRDIYKLVTTNEPIDRFAIIDIEDDARIDQYEVLAGVGVTGKGDNGHHTPKASELFEDIVFDNHTFHIESLVEKALTPLIKGHSNSLPLHKYIREYSDNGKRTAPSSVTRYAKHSLDEFLSETLKNRRKQHPIESVEILNTEATTEEKKAELFTNLVTLENEAQALGDFLKSYLTEHPGILDSKNKEHNALKTNLKRLIKIYDWLLYGKQKTPETPSEKAIK
ncbi:hypothetical protein Rhal01_02614 [Rubritalea halochordaticola]|uniref:SIR2-like domain-containing protein n=1 Tax=Rubritalea halochordaticola TaxID=714537 RepID=A0ABP9V5Q4_9BACT